MASTTTKTFRYKEYKKLVGKEDKKAMLVDYFTCKKLEDIKAKAFAQLDAIERDFSTRKIGTFEQTEISTYRSAIDVETLNVTETADDVTNDVTNEHGSSIDKSTINRRGRRRIKRLKRSKENKALESVERRKI
jgi:hypothetical protein